ncbi:hypothetical protein [Shinella sp. JR1-6]|uniref:hypothetical protein n=1 Tax=Shinella sp. JR1-6 TaxID=2527671 RepID=UPI00102D5D04|nr:hypothetical protein [Shinella sp. JR1-6]TAA54015.1 hypothetical protein EXZ48_27255 [Shinella sp. JR1-6]
MDLASFDTVKSAGEGAVMEVLHPADGTVLKDDNGQPITITLMGADSEKAKRRQRAEINKRLKSGRNTKITAEEMEENGVNLLALCTLSWSGIKLDGHLLECNAENAAMIYQRMPWLREQVDTFVGDRGNFLKA